MKISAKILALVLAMALLGVAALAEAESPKLASIQEKGKIVLGTDAVWAPFEYIGANGEPTGADVEIAQYIADQLGVELEVMNVSFETLTTYLVNDEIDIVLAAMTITEERAETVDFSNPYTVAAQYIVVPEDDDTTVYIDDLAGKAIGVHLGTTGDFIASDEVNLPDGVLNGTGAVVQQYKSLPDAALAMKNGELGAIICDTLMAENLVATNSGLKCFEMVYANGDVTTEEYGIAIRKGDEAFVNKINEIIAPIVEDGTIDGWIVEHTELASQID
ncbi:MAG: transporter substrate-binding domain-containing protein [Clostridia bacterium]|nr:transporter substrate-binding domain-containing protein [Clostridia bacterium]